MVKIGFVDLGNSHPENFAKDLKALGYNCYGVYDEFRLRDGDHLKAFAQRHDLKIFDSLDEMAQEVDVAFIHSVNWDLHKKRAEPFIKRNKGVYIDKPMFGNPADLNEVLKLYEEGARITGGSMILYTDEIRSLNDDKRYTGGIKIIFAGSPNDGYFYGIHAVYMVCGVLGFEVEGCKYMGEKDQKIYEIIWKNKKRSYLALGDLGIHYPFHMTIISDMGIKQLSFLGSKARRKMLSEVIPYLAGKGEEIISLRDLAVCEKICYAFKESELNGGSFIRIEELPEKPYYDGFQYEKIYKAGMKG